MATDPEASDLIWQRRERILYGGLIALCFTSILQLVDKDTLNLYLTIAAYSFAISLPLVVRGFLIVPSGANSSQVSGGQQLLNLIGIVAAILGVANLFLHFSITIGVIFIAGILVNAMLLFATRKGS